MLGQIRASFFFSLRAPEVGLLLKDIRREK